jgi:O-methyltransferase
MKRPRSGAALSPDQRNLRDLCLRTIQALEPLYPKLSPGGFCIIDDYALPPCRQAVADYRAKHGIAAEIVPVDWTGVYWRKPA